MPDTNPRKLPQLQFVESIFYCCSGTYGAASWCRRLNGQDIGLSRQQSGFESRRHHHMPGQLSRQSVGLKIPASVVRSRPPAPKNLILCRVLVQWPCPGLQNQRELFDSARPCQYALLFQREKASLTRKRSVVRIHHRVPIYAPVAKWITAYAF